MGPQKKHNPLDTIRKHQQIIGLTAVVLIIVLVSVGFYEHQRPKVNCQKLIDETSKLINQKKGQEAYDKLLPYDNVCAGNNGKQTKFVRLEYEFRLTVSAYQSGHQQQARSTASDTLKILKSIPPSDLTKIRQESNLVTDMADIQAYNIYPQARRL